MTDGAQNAMLGYLFQFSLIASLRAYSAGDFPAGSGWRTLVGHIAGGRLTSEMFGQDGVGAVPKGGQKEWVALQVKHSGDTAKVIDLQFFVELLYGFDQSRRFAASEGIHFQRFYVLTNLQPDSNVGGLWQIRSATALERELCKRKKTGKWSEWVARLFKPYVSEADAISNWSSVLAGLEPILIAPYDFGFEGLRCFARRHGVLDSELEQNLLKLVGQLTSDAAAGRSVEITESWLKQLLVGAPDARDASFTATGGMLDAARGELTTRLEDLTDKAHSFLTRRRYTDELLAKVSQHNVTFISGGGGSGKSVIAIQHLLAAPQGPLGLSLRAADIRPDSVAVLLRDLRSGGAGNSLPSDTLDQAVSRLKIANPGRDVLLAVNVDALDETDPALRGEISRIIREFVYRGRDGLRGKLLVSCRPRQHRFRGVQDLIQEWIDTEYPDRFTDRVALVEVGDFDAAEMQAAEALLNDPSDERLNRTSDVETIEGSEPLSTDRESGSAGPELIHSLRHPVVWGAYIGLNPEERRWVRSGTNEGTDCLAAAFVGRFFGKCAARRNHLVQQHHLEQALRRVAAATVNAVPPFGQQGVWQTACRSVLGLEDTTFLYGEALTYGLIEEDQRPSWRWRHGFVAQYLARGEA